MQATACSDTSRLDSSSRRTHWYTHNQHTLIALMPHNVLIIDDDEKLAKLVEEYCAGYDIKVTSAYLPSKGVELLNHNDFDAIILDVMLPEMDGFEVVKTIRGFSEIPIIMLTARGDVMDRVVGLELGADDYLPKPFEPRELVARINSIVKPMEYHLLLLLADSPGKDFSRDDILNHLKGTETELFSRSVDILISRLRAKLKPLKPIKTVYGSGYAFVASPVTSV